MSKVKEAAISIAAGVASVPLFLSMGIHANITNASIEACAKNLEHPTDPYPKELPADCNSTSSVFPTKIDSFTVVSSPGEEPQPATSQRYELLSPQEYKEKANELKIHEESKALIEKFTSFAGGIAVMGGTFGYMSIYAPRRREAKQAEQAVLEQALGVLMHEQAAIVEEQQIAVTETSASQA